MSARRFVVLLLSFFLLCISLVRAQEWTRTIVLSSHDTPRCVRTTSDSGFIIAGECNGGGFVLRTNQNGDTIWSVIHASLGYGFFTVCQTPDSGFVAVRNYYSPLRPQDTIARAVEAVKYNSNGTLQWSHQYAVGQNSTYGADVTTTDVTTSSGGLIQICGYSYQLQRPFLMVLAQNGDSLRCQTYGDIMRYVYTISHFPNGDCVLGGGSFSTRTSRIRTDSLGNLISITDCSTYGCLAHCGGLLLARNGNYFAYGYGGQVGINWTYGVARLNSRFDTLWTHSYFPYEEVGAYSATEISGGYLFAGYISNDQLSDTNFRFNHLYTEVFKIDISGNVLWSRFIPSRFVGDRRQQVASTSDGGFVLIADVGHILLMKFDSSASPTSIRETKPQLPNLFTLSKAYPNPFNATTTIRYSLPTANNISLDIINMNGEQVTSLYRGRQSSGAHSIQIHSENFASGIYFVRLQSGSQTAMQKIVLLK